MDWKRKLFREKEVSYESRSVGGWYVTSSWQTGPLSAEENKSNFIIREMLNEYPNALIEMHSSDKALRKAGEACMRAAELWDQGQAEK